MALRFKSKKNKYQPILSSEKNWPLVQMSENRKGFIQLVVDESSNNILSHRFNYSLRETLEKTVHKEKQRAKNNPWKVDPQDDYAYWNKLQYNLGKLDGLNAKDSEEQQKQYLKEIIERYSNEIAGNFNRSHYHVTRLIVTLGFKRLLNVARGKGPWTLFNRPLGLENKIHIKGAVEQLRKLAQQGTVVMVPTHFSNIDSVLIGWVIHFLGLPPFIYGAGLNLFNIKIFAYFMNSIGAYKVDRRKKNSIYLECLKAYSNIVLRKGYHSLFFPGGTRSRSGKIEKNLKLGLLGTTIEAQRRIFELEDYPKNKKIFIVPVTINYHFVLEAPSLIKDYLKRKGKERYYEENDEFTTSFKISKFLMKFFTKGSNVSVNIGRAIDVLGNLVDSNGNSLGKNGELIELSDYFKSDGVITENKQREQEYNRILSKRIVAEFHKNNRVFSSHLVAFTAYRMLEAAHSGLDLYGLLRLHKDDLAFEYKVFRAGIVKMITALKALKEEGKIGMAGHLDKPIDDIIKHGIKNLGMYHAQPPMELDNNNKVQVKSMNLLYYYHNRLEGYELEKYLQ